MKHSPSVLGQIRDKLHNPVSACRPDHFTDGTMGSREHWDKLRVNVILVQIKCTDITELQISIN